VDTDIKRTWAISEQWQQCDYSETRVVQTKFGFVAAFTQRLFGLIKYTLDWREKTRRVSEDLWDIFITLYLTLFSLERRPLLLRICDKAVAFLI
jgi:hypothetical protein